MGIQAVFEPAEDGGFTVYVPLFPGCISEGDTFEEAVANIIEAVESYIYTLMKKYLYWSKLWMIQH